MTVLLVLAKAPVPGQAKTRLTPPLSPVQAAGLAAAALLDTVDAVLATPGTRPVIALTGDVGAACRGAEVDAALSRCAVIDQRGPDFPTRLANAHADVAARYPGERVLQIGMDTPQITPTLLATALTHLDHADAVLGAAADGGWWALGLRDPRWATVLRDIPTSRPDTGTRTHHALLDAGHTVRGLPVHSDVDTIADVRAVAAAAPTTRFARAAAQVTR